MIAATKALAASEHAAAELTTRVAEAKRDLEQATLANEGDLAAAEAERERELVLQLLARRLAGAQRRIARCKQELAEAERADASMRLREAFPHADRAAAFEQIFPLVSDLAQLDRVPRVDVAVVEGRAKRLAKQATHDAARADLYDQILAIVNAQNAACDAVIECAAVLAEPAPRIARISVPEIDAARALARFDDERDIGETNAYAIALTPLIGDEARTHYALFEYRQKVGNDLALWLAGLRRALVAGDLAALAAPARAATSDDLAQHLFQASA